VHFARLATTLLEDEESARDNHVLACNVEEMTLCLAYMSISFPNL